MADLHSKMLDDPSPRGPNSQSHAVCGKFWQNFVLAPLPPLEGWQPNLREILDPPLLLKFDDIKRMFLLTLCSLVGTLYSPQV